MLLYFKTSHHNKDIMIQKECDKTRNTETIRRNFNNLHLGCKDIWIEEENKPAYYHFYLLMVSVLK